MSAPRRPRRVPVVYQASAADCGPACLAMVLGAFGRRTSTAEVGERAPAGRDGTAALTLAQAARSFGLEVRAFSVEPEHFAQLALPAIAHWGFEHFVVVERWSARGATIVDPALGRRQVDAQEFDRGLSGVVLTFALTPAFVRRRRAPSSTWPAFLRRYLAQAPGTLAQAALASVLVLGCSLSLPLATKLVVDHLLPARLAGLWPLLALALACTVGAQLTVAYLRSILLVHLQAHTDRALVPRFFDHLLRLPYAFFERRSSGDLLMRLASHAVVREILTGQVLSLAFDGLLALVSLGALLALDPRLGLLALGLGALQLGLLLGRARRATLWQQREVLALAESQSYVVEALAGIATLKAAGAEEQALAQWGRRFDAEVAAAAGRGVHAAWTDAALGALRLAAPLALLGLGAQGVLDGRLGLGSMLAGNALAAAFLAPLGALLQNGQRLPLLAVHLERLALVWNEAPEQQAGPEAYRGPLRGRLELREVGFRYHPDGPWVLRGVCCTVEPGRVLGLVGPTGCGKTTLLKLLLGFYPPCEGQILYDGVPLRDWDLRALRQQFGVVLQEPLLFSGPIRANVGGGDRRLSLDEVRAAARLAAIDDEIMALPMGYETRLSEGEAGLSGGQRQRLCLARAVAHRPRLLFLDEATSQLDSVTEGAIEEHLRDLGATRVVIAHRLGSVARADEILVLSAGEVVERGRHSELLARGGLYARLAQGQLEAPNGRGLPAA